ncbi:hypothetical protein OG21DRAFT_1290403 [Imleria badia]|nr:hypothetical protein OG21DRAFT_1290403 [Imleria badia]
MTINFANPFKSQTSKTFAKSKIGRDLHAGERFPSADVNVYSGKKIFKFGTATTVVDDDLSKPKPLEHVKVAQSSGLFDADIHVEKRKKILSKIKLAKDNFAKLFKPTGRVSSEAVACIDPFAISSVEHSTPNSSTMTPASILRHAEPKVQVVTAYECIPARHTSLEEIASLVAYSENAVDEHFEDLISTVCSLVEAPSSSPTAQLFAKPESQLERLPSMLFLGGLHTIEEADGSTDVGVANTEQKALTTSGSYISQSNSDSGSTVYLSSDSLSDYSTAHGVGLVGSETNTSPVDTSLATSVDAENSRQLLPEVLRRLRRVPNYEDLRNIQIIANCGSPGSDISCGSSECDPSHGAASGIKAAPLRRSMQCDNLRKLFLSFEPRICTPPIRQMNKYKKLPAWLKRRCHEPSRDARKTSASRAPSEPEAVTSASRSRQFLRSIFHPSPRVQARVSKPSSHQPSPPQSPPIWSCAKITRSSPKMKNRRRVTKRSMRELKARLDSMDIDPWY